MKLITQRIIVDKYSFRFVFTCCHTHRKKSDRLRSAVTLEYTRALLPQKTRVKFKQGKEESQLAKLVSSFSTQFSYDFPFFEKKEL